MSFFRWTGRQIAKIPEEVKVPQWQERQKVRKSIWQQIGELVEQGDIDKNEFEPWSIQEMKNGRAAWCPESQRTGNDITDHKYHIHHKTPRRLGGKNEKENLVITTPLYHDTTLDPVVHYWEHHAKKKEEKKKKNWLWF